VSIPAAGADLESGSVVREGDPETRVVCGKNVTQFYVVFLTWVVQRDRTPLS